MVKLFFGNRSLVLLLLPFMVAIYFGCNFFTDYHLQTSTLDLGLWGEIPNKLWYVNLIAPVLIVSNALVINNIYNRNQFLDRNNYLVALLYVTFMSYFHSFYYFESSSIAQALCITVLYQLFKLNQNEDGRRAVFNAAFLLGLASTFYPLLLLSFPFFFWMIWVLRPFVLRESMLAIAGYVIPMIYVAVYSYIMEKPMDLEHFSIAAVDFFGIDFMMLGGGIAILSIASASVLIGKLRVSSVRLKKLMRLIALVVMVYAGMTIIEYLVFKKFSTAGLLIFPLMFYLAYAFGTKEQRAFPTFVYYIIFLFSVSKFFIPFEALGL